MIAGTRRTLARATRRRGAAFILAVAACLGANAGHAQQPGDSLVISVLTMGPGQEIFERFGHQSIRVHDLRTGLDSAYNWGMFDFNQPRFLQRFLTGDTRYWMQGFPTLPLVGAYREAGRWVVEQDLALTPVQADSLWRFIQWNARDENKWYRYDYYLDNCATRVRDALDRVLGGAVKRGAVAREHGVSYRSETLRLGAAFPVLNTAMDFALGRPADATLSAWDEAFVPMRLRTLLPFVRVRQVDGTVVSLVSAERVLVADHRFDELSSPPDLLPGGLIAGLSIAGIVLVLCALPWRVASVRWTLALVGGTWHLVAGLTGLLVLVLGTFTHHVFMARNANVLLATPASLALAVLFPMVIVRAASPRLRQAAWSLAVISAVCALTAIVLRFVPAWMQENRPLLALAVPAQLALTFALWRATTERD